MTPAPVVEPGSPALRDALTSACLVLVWFAVAALVGALVWWQVTPLAEYTRTGISGSMDEEQLSRQFATDGWFIVVAGVGGLLSGLLLVLLRRRNPVLMVLLVALGGALATYLMLKLGLAFGPEKPAAALRSTPEGGKVPLQLKPAAHAVRFVWSVTALLGGILALWIAEARSNAEAQAPAALGQHDAGYGVPNRE